MATRVLIVSFIGAVVGAIALTVLTFLLHLALRIPDLRDGQYPLILFFKPIIGGLLGAATALGILFHVRDQYLVSAVIYGAVGLALGFLCLSGNDAGQYGGRLRNLLVYSGWEVLWCGSLVLLALRSLQASR